MLATMVWRVSPSFNGLSESEIFWGIPHSHLFSATVFNNRSHRVRLLLPFFSATLHTSDYSPLVGVNTDYHLRSETLHLDLPPPPFSTRFELVLSTQPLHGEGDSYITLNPTASKFTFVWGSLASLSNLLIIFSGFTGVITEACMYTISNPSCRKSFPRFYLPMDSSGQFTSSSSLFSFSLELRAILSPVSFMRNVFSPNTKWRCVSLSIIVLSSCLAVRMGPEDATDIVSMIFRDADWILTSQYKVTKSQVSGTAVLLASTHSIFVSSSLSFYLRGFSTFGLYGLLVVVVGVWLNSFVCSLNV